MLKTAHVSYRGNVQGVGFRYTAQELARRHGMRGYVRNLPDGSVELLAQGEERDVKGYLGALRQRMCLYIETQDVDWSESEKIFTEFDVRF